MCGTCDIIEVVKLISEAPCKNCQLDPWPTWLLKRHLSSVSLYLAAMFNLSLTTGIFPTEMKLAIVTPLLKKQSLNGAECSNFRPVSNLSFISKILEKIV